MNLKLSRTTTVVVTAFAVLAAYWTAPAASRYGYICLGGQYVSGGCPFDNSQCSGQDCYWITYSRPVYVCYPTGEQPPPACDSEAVKLEPPVLGKYYTGFCTLQVVYGQECCLCYHAGGQPTLFWLDYACQ